jgi:hypothetical protein
VTDAEAKKLLIAAVISGVIGDDWAKLKELATNADFLGWLLDKLL